MGRPRPTWRFAMIMTSQDRIPNGGCTVDPCAAIRIKSVAWVVRSRPGQLLAQDVKLECVDDDWLLNGK